MTGKAARAAVREMRQLAERPRLASALAAGTVTAMAGWTSNLPPAVRDETDRILLQAAAAGASHDELAIIAWCAVEQWRR